VPRTQQRNGGSIEFTHEVSDNLVGPLAELLRLQSCNRIIVNDAAMQFIRKKDVIDFVGQRMDGRKFHTNTLPQRGPFSLSFTFDFDTQKRV
jgi:hypothetical protein